MRNEGGGTERGERGRGGNDVCGWVFDDHVFLCGNRVDCCC